MTHVTLSPKIARAMHEFSNAAPPAPTVASLRDAVAGLATDLRVRNTEQLSTRSRRRVILAGAVCVAALGVGMALNSRTADPEQGPVTTARPALAIPPLRPDRFPLVPADDPRAIAATALYGNQIGWQNPPTTEALVARIEGDTMSDAVVLSMSNSSTSPFAPTTETVTIAGTDMMVYVEEGTPIITTVVLHGTPTFVATGIDPVAFLESVGGFPIADSKVNATGEVSFTLGTLPEGYEVVVPPTPLPLGSFDASTRVPDGDAGDGMSVWVEVHNSLLGEAAAGDLRRVDINGISGWMRDDGPGSPVVWQVSDTTWARIGGAPTLNDAVQLARALTFVDEATWRERYGLELPLYLAKVPGFLSAYCTNGRVGYVRDEDLNGELMPRNPNEAATWSVPEEIIIPCYAEDGVTVIGEFVING